MEVEEEEEEVGFSRVLGGCWEVSGKEEEVVEEWLDVTEQGGAGGRGEEGEPALSDEHGDDDDCLPCAQFNNMSEMAVLLASSEIGDTDAWLSSDHADAEVEFELSTDEIENEVINGGERGAYSTKSPSSPSLAVQIFLDSQFKLEKSFAFAAFLTHLCLLR